MSVGNVKTLGFFSKANAGGEVGSLFRLSVCQPVYMEILWIPKSSTAKSAAEFLFLVLPKQQGSPQGYMAWLAKAVDAVFPFPPRHCTHVPHPSKG